MVARRRLRGAIAALAIAIAAVAIIATACGVGDISDLTAGRHDAGTGVDADPDAPDAAACIHAYAPERPTTADGVSLPLLVFAMQNLRFETGELDGGPPKPEGLDLDQTCTCPEPESCVPPDSGAARLCDGDGGRDNVAGSLLAIASATGTGFGPETIRGQLSSGLFSLLISIQAWNGQPDDPNVIVGVQVSFGSEGIQNEAGRVEPKFDGTDVYTVAPSSVLGGVDRFGVAGKDDCRTLFCAPTRVDAVAYVRAGVVVAHMDIPLPIQTATGTFEIDFLEATLTGRITQEGGVQRLTGEIAGRWPADRILGGFARARNPQTSISLCASDAGLEIYSLLRKSVCDSVDLADRAALDRRGAPCAALSNAISYTAVKVAVGTIWRSDRTEPNDCPNFVDHCP